MVLPNCKSVYDDNVNKCDVCESDSALKDKTGRACSKNRKVGEEIQVLKNCRYIKVNDVDLCDECIPDYLLSLDQKSCGPLKFTESTDNLGFVLSQPEK